MSEALRNELRRVFADWESSRLTAQGVQNWARATSTQGADPFAARIVNHLRGLGEYLITCDDLPLYLQLFEKSPEDACKALDEAGNAFDVKARATDLKDDPFYGPHTRAILRELS